ncbi:hypothetical protein BJ917_0012 [Pseudomonas sp. WPR_5_2]|uniref:hypothetical protein n=1 Tax=Pseudomonas sp. WPR_5_2 TaxID=1907371 RepID=UPI000EB36A0D|nr:hypothetical protein [Pseudomonas sp. WPR_5_2]RKS27176.1 hypothetical protein BJ917_0012 [Pseudomonas sp. WPR_5_2]
MTDTSSVSSNANNFVSAVENGVDSRTGLYKISINLPEIKTNDLRGPGFDLRLYYSALNPRDSGWGHGWNMKLSQYIPSTQILSLSTGETFKVTGTDSQTGQLVMKEQKIDSFHFYPEGSNRYRVVHKSGLVEILEVLGSAQNRVALPVEIRSFTGHKITLGYVPFSGSDQILSWIKDDSGQTLLTVKRDSASVEVLLYPFSGPSGGPLANFVMTLQGSDRYVSKITLPTDNQASWRFGYTLKNDHLCITSVETPSGAREEIRYQDLGHQFPTGSGRTPLPRVTDHRIFPGSGQPMVQVGYCYCLGNPIALRDPSGHEAIGWSGRLRFPYEDEVPQLSGGSGGDWLSWVFVVLGAVGTVAAGAATVASFGAAAPLTGAAFGFAVAKTASLATATALSAGSTAASAVAAANGDEEAGQWGMYLGLASIVPGVAGAAFGSIARVVGNGLDDILINLAKNTDTSGTKMWGFSSDEVHKLGLRPISSAGPRLAASSNTPKFHPSLPGRNPVNANVKLPGTTAVNGTSGHPPINKEELSTQISKLKVPKPTAPPIRAETDQMKLIIEQKNHGKTIKEAAAHANQKSNRSDIVNSHLGMGPRR